MDGQVAIFRLLDRGVNGVPSADKLVQAEGENRESRSGVTDRGGSGKKRLGDNLPAQINRGSGQFRKLFGGPIVARKGYWFGTPQPI